MIYESSPAAAFGRALDWFGCHRAMARALGLTSRQMWLARFRGHVSGRMAEKIHKLTCGNVRREELRPDLYPREHHHERARKAHGRA